jgi:hypothetical protein
MTETNKVDLLEEIVALSRRLADSPWDPAAASLLALRGQRLDAIARFELSQPEQEMLAEAAEHGRLARIAWIARRENLRDEIQRLRGIKRLQASFHPRRLGSRRLNVSL